MASQYTPPVADDADFNFELGDYTPLPPLAADFDFALAIYNILAGYSNIFTAIWADVDAGRGAGRMYTLSYGDGVALSVVNLADKNLHDQYTQTDAGRADETLTDTDTRDLNVDTP
jgi:hypothetical protein